MKHTGYCLAQTLLAQGTISLEQITSSTEIGLKNVFRISNQDVVGYFIGVATIPILITLAVAALKRTFEKRFRH